MIARRLLLPIATLLLAASALAQLTETQKDEVLRGIDRVLDQEAFVPGVELGQWRKFISARQDKLDAAETSREFAYVVNGALSEFGVSHIQVSVDRMRRGGELALQGSQRYGSRFRPLEARWLDDDSALVRLSTFDLGYSASAVDRVFDEIKDAKYLVLDLRSNPGGEVENMRHFLAHVIPGDAAVGTFVSRRMASEYARLGRGDAKDPVAIAAWANRKFKAHRTDTEPFKGDIAVLIDGRSASASEIVANALREVRRSPLIGSKSMGAVLVSTFDRLPYGFKIQYPVSDYVSAKGLRIEGHPLTPDISLNSIGDSQGAIDAALDRLKGTAKQLESSLDPVRRFLSAA